MLYFLFFFLLFISIITIADVLWCDGDWEQTSKYWHAEEFLKWLYTASPVRDTVKYHCCSYACACTLFLRVHATFLLLLCTHLYTLSARVCFHPTYSRAAAHRTQLSANLFSRAHALKIYAWEFCLYTLRKQRAHWEKVYAQWEIVCRYLRTLRKL